jgi:hypothetical protein
LKNNKNLYNRWLEFKSIFQEHEFFKVSYFKVSQIAQTPDLYVLGHRRASNSIFLATSQPKTFSFRITVFKLTGHSLSPDWQQVGISETLRTSAVWGCPLIREANSTPLTVLPFKDVFESVWGAEWGEG